MNIVNLLLVKLINRALSDYPIARERLGVYAGKTVSVQVGPIGAALTLVRVTADGTMEMVGIGSNNSPQNVQYSPPDVVFLILPKLIPRLLRGDESAFSEVSFTGDSEFAATLSTIVRNIEWDVEEDLSKAVGDIAAHRLVGTVKSLDAWQIDMKERLTENLTEYLTEEKRAFITHRSLETLATANESLRDDIARLEARVAKLSRFA